MIIEEKHKQVLNILQKDARLSTKEIGVMLNLPEQEIKNIVEQLEQDRIILNYQAIINPEKINEEKISCVIEVKVSPERGVGFDAIAERIYRFPEVRSLFLMSGGYDFLVIIEGTTLKEAAQFVMEKLATLEHVQSTATHFLLKRYKDGGTILAEGSEDHRLPMSF